MPKLISSLLLPGFLIAQLSCGTRENKVPDNFTYGNIEKNIYHNDFFNVDIPFDTTWFVQNKEMVDQLTKAGSELVAGKNKNLKAGIEASKVNTAYLLTLFKYEVGSAVDFNPSFMVLAENTRNFPGVKRGKDYLFHAKKLMQQSQVQITVEKDFFEKKVGSKIFDIMEAKVNSQNTKITQEYMSTILNGFAFSFILSYSNEEEKNELYSMLEKIDI